MTLEKNIEMNPNYDFVIQVILNESDATNKETFNMIVKSLEKAKGIYPDIIIYVIF